MTLFSSNKLLSVSGRIVLICEFIGLTVRSSHLTEGAYTLSRVWAGMWAANTASLFDMKREGLFHRF